MSENKKKIDIKFFDLEKINPMFTKGKMYLLYAGLNRNASYLEKKNIEKAIPTIFNNPIVGEYYADTKNFGGHGASVEINEDGEIEYVLSTRPYGVVPESASIYWETVTGEDGIEREYLIVDGVLLWTGRYPEIATIMETGQYNQSMELQIDHGAYEMIDGQTVYNIKDFIFTGFCLLGVSKPSDEFGHVEPCFEDSKIVAYSLDKEEFTREFNQMIEELKFSLKEGGNNQMEQNTDLEVQVEATVDAETPENFDLEGVQDDIEKVAQNQGANVDSTPEEPAVDSVDEEDETEDTNPPEGEEGAEGGEEGADAGDTFSVSQEEYEALQANFAALEQEAIELRAYKRSREVADSKAKFAEKLEAKKLEEIFSANENAAIQDIETLVYAEIGKQYATFSKQQNENTNKMNVSPQQEQQEANPYGDLFN